MKNSKMFFTLVIASISCLCNAYENSDSTALIPVAQVVIHQELVPNSNNSEHSDPRMPLERLFYECYREGDAQACQQLIAMFIYKTMSEKSELREIIASQQKTIESFQKSFDAREKRKIGRRKQRHALLSATNKDGKNS